MNRTFEILSLCSCVIITHADDEDMSQHCPGDSEEVHE